MASLSEHARDIILFFVLTLIILFPIGISAHCYFCARSLQKQRDEDIERGALKDPSPLPSSSSRQSPSLKQPPSSASSRKPADLKRTSIPHSETTSNVPPPRYPFMDSDPSLPALRSSASVSNSISLTPPPTAYVDTFWHGALSPYPELRKGQHDRHRAPPVAGRERKPMPPHVAAESEAANPCVPPGIPSSPPAEAHVRQGDVREAVTVRLMPLDVGVRRIKL